MSYYAGRHVEREILSALIDGELDPYERRYVHEHLQSCADCREAADEFAHIHGMVVKLPRLVAPEAFVSHALRPKERRFLSGPGRWIALGLAGGAIAITLAGLFPEKKEAPPVDAFIARHLSLDPGVETGGGVLFTVNGR